MLARREIKKKSDAASSVREFQEKFRIPQGVDVTRLSSEISGDGVLIITGEDILFTNIKLRNFEAKERK